MTDEWEKTIGLADMHGTRASVSFMPADPEGDAMLTLTLRVGGVNLYASPTPEAARQLAAALLDAADGMEG